MPGVRTKSEKAGRDFESLLQDSVRINSYLWKTELCVSDHIVPLNEFTQTYIGNVLRGIVLSLGYDSKDITAHLNDAGLHIYIKNSEIPILKDFARLLIESTIKGVLSPLKGVFWLQEITVTTKNANTQQQE